MTREEALWHLDTYSSTLGSGQTTQEQHEEAKRIAIEALENADQIRRERDTAIQQLKDLGYGLGEKPRTDGDTISRQAAIEVIDAAFPVDPMKSEYTHGLACGVALAKTYVEQLPSAQPERKKGKWIVYKAPDKYHCGMVKCPFCGEDMIAESDEYNFCPNCGTDMRGEQDD